MSGPKHGNWTVAYDPTPARLNDLRSFAGKLDRWLECHGDFLERHLGAIAVVEARNARNNVQRCIDIQDPDGGFIAYGTAWETLNRLHREATAAQRQRQREAYEAFQRQQQQQQQLAAAAVAQCRQCWSDSANQTLLQRWSPPQERRSLAGELVAVAEGPAPQVTAKARQWQDRFDTVLAMATAQKAENTRALQAAIPQLRKIVTDLGSLNVAVLPPAERQSFEGAKVSIQETAQQALAEEMLAPLGKSITQLRSLLRKTHPLIKAAELRKASDAWRIALEKCGYTVSVRTAEDGSLILQASGFPTRSASVTLDPQTHDVKLHVGDPDGHGRCVRDVQALQAQLQQQGVQLTMTDWGKPGGMANYATKHLQIGGV
jgi:hypothetical protein